jgi:predicted nucleic-acid-binding protein
VKITADTNILIRAIVEDDPRQAKAAQAALAKAEVIVLTLPSLCEFAWVLSQGYAISNAKIANTLRDLIGAANVVLNRAAAQAGVALLDAGGDFVDGVIAHEANWLGAEAFVSFDKKAVKLLKAQGNQAYVLT